MDMLFREFCEPYQNDFIEVIVNETKVKKLNNFVKKVIHEKIKENHHKIDNKNEYKRFYTGMLGELALEQYLNKNFVDLSIGKSSDYNSADLKKIGIKIGVKTVEYGKFPVIYKNSYYPEIIILKTDINKVLICGIATVDVLKQYQNEDFILSPLLKKRNTKTGFYGFDKLISFKTIEDIKKIIYL